VKECDLRQQTNNSPTLPNKEDPDDDGKSCKVHDRLIKATAKGIFYNAYLISFPLQVVVIFALIAQKMFNEEYTIESCESFVTIFNNTNQQPYYDCSYGVTIDTSDKVASHCSGNISAKDFKEINIDCTQYYFETSTLIEGVIIGYSAHLLLSKILVYLVHFLHFLVRRTALIEVDGIWHCCERRVFIPAVLLVIVLIIPLLVSTSLVIVFVLRLSSDTIREILDGIIHGNRVWDLLTYGGMIMFPSFLVFSLMVLCKFKFLDKEYRLCLTHVSCAPPNHQPFILYGPGNSSISMTPIQQTSLPSDRDCNQSVRGEHPTGTN